MSPRRRLLLITPVLPAEEGNGLAMRAGLFLEALAADHEVSLLVAPVADPDPARESAFVARHAARTAVLDLRDRLHPHLLLISRLVDPEARREALRRYPRPLLTGPATREAVEAGAAGVAGIAFDAVHVMRLYAAPFAEPWLPRRRGEPGPRCVLDLDDDDVEVHRQLSALHAARGLAALAREAADEAQRYARLAAEYLPRFDRALVAGEPDRVAIEARHGLPRVAVVPNAVRLDGDDLPPRPAAWRLLFVGTLGYAPNADAVRLLCEEILPAARARAGRSIEAELVGRRPSAEIARLAARAGVRLVPDAPTVVPHYAAARVAVVPIRAAGGTRIKILEAFAAGCPVVATPAGARGLAVEDGVHLLLAESPAAFADACVRLLADDALADALRAAARELVRSRYAAPLVAADIRRLYRDLLAPAA